MKRFMSMVVALVFMLSVAPAFAAPEQITTIPAEKEFSSIRFDLASSLSATIDGQSVSATTLAGRGVATAAGVHIAYYDTIENVVLEIIQYDDTIYVRTGNETRWKATRISPDAPVADVDQLPEGSFTQYRLEDEVTVRGTPTTQYQLQISPSVLPSGFKVLNANLFLSKTDNARLKDQTTAIVTDPTLGDITLQEPYEYYGFNDPANVVHRPSADLVDAAQINIEFPGARALKPWTRVIAARQLAELRTR